MSQGPRILILRLSSLGDILHTLPAFASLRAAFPRARIDWLAAEKCRSLAAAIRGVDRVHVLDARALARFPPDRAAWKRLRGLIRELRAARYDLAIDFQGLLKSAVLGLLSGAQTRIGFSRPLAREWPAHLFYHRTLPRPPSPVHVSELNRLLAGLAGADPGLRAPFELEVSEADGARVDRLLAPIGDFVVLNPGGGWGTKRWSPERFGLLAARIQSELGLETAVTTGPGEEGLYRAIAAVHPSAHHLPLSFIEMIPLLRKARLMVSGDTGPFHLACALAVPVVGIFGPTSPARNGPWHGTCAEGVTRALACSPCYARKCRSGAECMDIAVEEVFAAVAGCLRAEKGGSTLVP
jgi:lipopolysaccharide heptosyltransferase I